MSCRPPSRCASWCGIDPRDFALQRWKDFGRAMNETPRKRVAVLPDGPVLPMAETRRDTPEVSVVMATYNRSNILRYAIESVRWQTRTDWELLVISDAGTDDAAD